MSHQFFAAVANAYKEQSGKESAQGPGWTVEPHVAEKIFLDMLAADKVPTHVKQPAQERAHERAPRITELTTESGDVYQARVFIDATYEGDLMAAARVSSTTIREANSQYGETQNGFHIGTQSAPGVDPYIKPGDPTSGPESI